jgi:hypothetical protein
MKISTIIHIITCLLLLLLVTGCSRTNNQVSTLWEERKMDDNRRLYGNPYEGLNRQQQIFSFIPFIESSFIILFRDPRREHLYIKPAPSDSATTIQDDVFIESQSFPNSHISVSRL